MNSTIQSTFTFTDSGKSVRVNADRAKEANAIDRNHDGVLSDNEIVDHLVATDALPQPGENKACDVKQVLKEYKLHLSKAPNPTKDGYHSYDSLSAELADMEAQHPDLCQRVSLGKTAEGRDIWALKISKDAQGDTSAKTGVVITGGTHAREWISPEIPLNLAHNMLDNYATDAADQKRVNEGETWIIPLVNPDGYEYSRNSDNWWRKNRRPVETDACGQATSAIGVDPDRNYWDGNPAHLTLWRPDGDTPQSTTDDFPMTSDDPDSDCYRGPQPASEVEIQSLLKLELGHQNIRGVIDHHSYGDLILYPWGHSSDPVPDMQKFVDIGNKMNAAMDNSFEVQQSAGLYPDSGESDDCQYVNGLTSYILEVGHSFQPDPSTIKETCDKLAKANLVFIDEIQARAAAGTLPEHGSDPTQSAPPAPPSPQPPSPQPPQPDPGNGNGNNGNGNDNGGWPGNGNNDGRTSERKGCLAGV